MSANLHKPKNRQDGDPFKTTLSDLEIHGDSCHVEYSRGDINISAKIRRIELNLLEVTYHMGEDFWGPIHIDPTLPPTVILDRIRFETSLIAKGELRRNFSSKEFFTENGCGENTIGSVPDIHPELSDELFQHLDKLIFKELDNAVLSSHDIARIIALTPLSQLVPFLKLNWFMPNRKLSKGEETVETTRDAVASLRFIELWGDFLEPCTKGKKGLYTRGAMKQSARKYFYDWLTCRFETFQSDYMRGSLPEMREQFFTIGGKLPPATNKKKGK